MSAEDVLRQRMIDSRSPRELKLAADLDDLPRLWDQLERASLEAPRRLEQSGWPGGRLVQASNSSRWDDRQRKVIENGEYIDLAVWHISTFKLTDGDGSTYHHLHVGSNGKIYTSASYQCQQDQSLYVKSAVVQWFRQVMRLDYFKIHPENIVRMENSMLFAKNLIEEALTVTNQLGH